MYCTDCESYIDEIKELRAEIERLRRLWEQERNVTDILERKLDEAVAAERERCIRAVDDAGGDNTQYHIDAIRTRSET